MLFLACTEHTSTMSPVNETQDYDCLYQVKGAVIIWSLRDDMCRIESQKAMDCVQFAVNACICICEMLFLTCTEQNKVLVKFGTFEMMCVELRAKKLRNVSVPKI